ncbi:10320_t:CDS:2, partial [Racocetra fulgida]
KDHDTPSFSEPSDINDTESSENRPKKMLKIRQSAQVSIIESEDSPSFKSFQSVLKSEKQLEASNKLFRSKNNRNEQQLFPDQSLKVPDVEILTNNVKSNPLPSNVSWVWGLRNIQNEFNQSSTYDLEDLEWPLLDNDDDSESESDNIFESPTQAEQSPLTEAYIASYLDPRFKNLSFTNNEKKKEVLDLLCEIIKTNNTAINAPARTEMDRFFDSKIPDYVVDDELERYKK